MSDLRNEPRAVEPEEFPVPAAQPVEPAVSDELELTYATGLEVQARSQWAYARRRFVRHRLAMVSLVILFIILGAGLAADWVAPYAYDEIDLENSGVGPTLEGKHFFGTDVLGRDYFSRVIYGIQTSERVAFIVAALSTLIGVLDRCGRRVLRTLGRQPADALDRPRAHAPRPRGAAHAVRVCR